jgi:serine/threonine protein kinase
VSAGQDFLGPYRLIRLVRSGRRCGVWEAVRQGETERVALKVLLEAHKKQTEEVEHLKNEAKVGKTLDHPNVIRIYDFIATYQMPFLVMQLFSVRNLKQEMRERPDFVAINVPQYVRKCALALQHLHDKGWVHCDVKPDNFLVDEQGGLKMIDFSIAQPIRTGFRLGDILGGRGRAVTGTRSYMSPEQIRGKSLDARADIYGFGCLVFELLAGKPPFTATNPDELLSKHLRSPPPSLQAYNRGVSSEFAGLVNRLLEKNRDLRPKSMADVLLELERINVYRAGMRPRLKA